MIMTWIKNQIAFRVLKKISPYKKQFYIIHKIFKLNKTSKMQVIYQISLQNKIHNSENNNN